MGLENQYFEQENIVNPEKLKSHLIKNIGFDLDGTLIDTMVDPMDNIPKRFGRYLQEKFGISKDDAELFFKKTHGMSTNEQIADLVWLKTFLELDEKEAIHHMEIVDDSFTKVPAKVFSEVPTILTHLKEEGFNLFVSSSHRPEAIRNRLVEFNLDQYFGFVAGKSVEYPEFTKGEPHFRAAALHYGIPYEDFCKSTLYFGDSLSDIQAANKAGVYSIARIGTYSEEELAVANPRMSIGDFTRLREVIQQVEKNMQNSINPHTIH